MLDSPELMWAEPRLEPVYGAVRSYLEMDQRVGLLMERLGVLSDLLAVLKDQVRTSHGEALEWIGECIFLTLPLSLLTFAFWALSAACCWSFFLHRDRYYSRRSLTKSCFLPEIRMS